MVKKDGEQNMVSCEGAGASPAGKVWRDMRVPAIHIDECCRRPSTFLLLRNLVNNIDECSIALCCQPFDGPWQEPWPPLRLPWKTPFGKRFDGTMCSTSRRSISFNLDPQADDLVDHRRICAGIARDFQRLAQACSSQGHARKHLTRNAFQVALFFFAVLSFLTHLCRVNVVSDAFKSKMQPARHRMVYTLLKDELAAEGGIHALQLKTRTVEEEEKAKARETEAS